MISGRIGDFRRGGFHVFKHRRLGRNADSILRHSARPDPACACGRHRRSVGGPCLGRRSARRGKSASGTDRRGGGERAFQNFLETFPFFAASVLLVHALDKSTHTSVLGAQIYIWARVLYVPAYVIAIPFVRTLIWAASLVGILMVLSAIWPG